MNPQQLENLTPDQVKDLYQALQERRGALILMHRMIYQHSSAWECLLSIS